MHADVDMSGRIEETNRPTAVGLANGVQSSLWISAREKRLAIEALQAARPHRDRAAIHVRVFAILLFLLLREHLPHLQGVSIDPEYPGHEPTIKNGVMAGCRKQGIPVFADQLTFRRVGKKSPAHTLAYAVFKGRQKPDRIVTAREILAVFRQ